MKTNKKVRNTIWIGLAFTFALSAFSIAGVNATTTSANTATYSMGDDKDCQGKKDKKSCDDKKTKTSCGEKGKDKK